jgi:hypothetical protein
MAEDPIKLFSTRPERYPEETDGDLARKAIEKYIEAVPGGSILTFVFSQFLPPLLERRLPELGVEGFKEGLVKVVDGIFIVEGGEESQVRLPRPA